MKCIDEWKKQEVLDFIEYVEKLESFYYDKTIDFVRRQQNTPMAMRQLIQMPDDRRKEQIEKLVDEHFEQLQNKVVAKIGKIKLIQQSGGAYDFTFIGENGSCKVQVIIAGGHTKQRRHTRWLIH